MRIAFIVYALLCLSTAKADVLLTAPIGSASGFGSQLSGAYGISCGICPGGAGTNSMVGETFIAPGGYPSLQSFQFYLQSTDFSTNLKLTAFVIPWANDLYPTGTLGPLGTFNNSIGGPSGAPVFVSSPINFVADSYNAAHYTPVQVNTGGLMLQPGQAYVIGLTTDDPNSPQPNTPFPAGPDNFTTSQGFASVAIVPSHPTGDGGGGLALARSTYIFGGPGNGTIIGYGGNQGGIGNFQSLSNGPYWNNLNNPANDAQVFPGFDYGDLAFDANFQATFTLSGTLAPTQQGLEYKELVYQLSDGVTTVNGLEALSGTCAALDICQFSQTLTYGAPLGFTPTSVKYTVLGFYGGGPQAGDVSCAFGFCSVFQNPDIFALTNSGFSGDFQDFWSPQLNNTSCTGPIQPPVCSDPRTASEDLLASMFYNGQTLLSENVSPGAYANFAPAGLGGGGNSQILDFSGGVFNGNADLTPSTSNEGPSSVPEPGGMGAIGLLLPTLWLRKRWSGNR